jgi:hypothetical protein
MVFRRHPINRDKVVRGYFAFNSFVRLIVEMILYRKYKGPVNISIDVP